MSNRDKHKSNPNSIRIFDDGQALYRAAAEEVARAGAEAIARDGKFVLLLSGGATPRRLYALLSAPPLDPSRTHLFLGDERGVRITNPQSNYRMISETLLSRVPFPPENIHRVKTDLPPDDAAMNYELELKEFFGGPPAFHLALLGMGADGHTASLFPGSDALRESERWVVATRAETPRRITLTFPALNACAEVLFLVTGAQKAPAVAAALQGPPDPDLPAQMVKPASGRVTWLLDRGAASLLKPNA